METVNQVKETTDYTMFKTLVGNRLVNKLHVKRLAESFRKAYLLSPIIVNEHYEIIDGQHRFEAAQEVGLPIYFLVAEGYGLAHVQMLNENMKNWKKIDYLNAYCDLKHPVYLKFRNFMREFPDFQIANAETILTNLSSSGRSRTNVKYISATNKDGAYAVRYFQEGNLDIPNYEKSVDNAKKIMQIKPYYEGYNRSNFVRAMIGIFKIDYYDHSLLLAKLKSNPMALQHCANVTQYKMLVEDTYNFRNRNKVSLRF